MGGAYEVASWRPVYVDVENPRESLEKGTFWRPSR